MWILVLALAAGGSADRLSGEYVAVTETEYAIELELEPSGQARLAFRTWEADDSAPSSSETLIGRWSHSEGVVDLKFKGDQSVRFKVNECLSYSEFGQPGCSPGLSLVSTTLPERYGLRRFGLWRTGLLRLAH